MKTIITYGSLRAGCHNHHWLGKDAKLVATEELAGFDMYDVGSYPCCVPSKTGSIVVEIYEVSDERHQFIRDIELGAGYQEITLNRIDLGDCFFYVYDRTVEHLKQVEGGDWSSYHLKN